MMKDRGDLKLKLLIVRHGKTDWNTEKRAAGLSDVKLNEEGINQAKVLQEKLKDTHIDVIISSPLNRAVKTAEIINESHNLEIVIDEEAIERNLGIYEGQPNEQEIFNEIRYYTKNVLVEGGEDCQTYTTRVFHFLDKIINQYKDKADTVLIVSHGFFLRSANWYFNGLPTEPEEVIRIKNCQIDEYDII